MFAPIAVIGRAGLFPGALTPEQLWRNTLDQHNSLAKVTWQQWGMDPNSLLATTARNVITTTTSGYVSGFETIFNPQGFHVAENQVTTQDLLCQWLVHTGREALADAGYALNKLPQQRVGGIVGNLSYPTLALSRYAKAVWLANQVDPALQHWQYSPILWNPQHRFMSGYPLHFMAQALGLTGECYALDAACASSLYAIKLACDQLHDGRADMMVAGGVNATDSLFLHLGFTALQALSKTGQSRPFHREADGLVPAQGIGLVVLKRLDDAIAAKDKIYGVIRAVGLSNDGNSRSFLIPAEEGQKRAMQQAYQLSGIHPDEVSWIECHATGTSIGDSTEINSMRQIFSSKQPIAISALKSTIGHSITASGAAALINVLSAFAAEQKPPTRYALENPIAELTDAPFRLLAATEPWQEKRKIAAINAFGFGGNNAHLLVEQYQPGQRKTNRRKSTPTAPPPMEDIAIVGMGIMAAGAIGREDFTQAWLQGRSLLREYSNGHYGGYIDSVELAIADTRFPPADLQHTLGQQLTILKTAQQALADVHLIDRTRTAIYIGMQCDAEIARYGLLTRLATVVPDADAAWLTAAGTAIHEALTSADTLGAMPNIVTNRLNVQFDMIAPSFSVSAEELSGIVALELGMRDLHTRAVDAVMVGAVDMCCEIVQRAAACNVLPAGQQIPGDAAVTLVLKRLSDAIAQQEHIYAIIPAKNQPTAMEFNLNNSTITHQFGHAHAASGLLHVAAAAIACHEQKLPGETAPTPWIVDNSPRAINVAIDAYGDQRKNVLVKEYN